MKLEFFQRFSKKFHIKFYQNQSSGSRVAAFGQTDIYTNRWTEMTKLIDNFCNVAKAPKN
jgi:hypothetical protein